MKILFDASILFHGKGGGVHGYLASLIPALLGEERIFGADVSFFHLHARRSNLEPPRALGKKRIHHLRFPVKLLNHLWLKARLPDLRWLYRDFDVFHSPHFSLPVMSRTRKVLTVNDITYLRHPELFQDRHRALNEYGYRKLLTENVRRADRIIAISRFTRDDLIDFFDLPASKVDVVHIGCDPHRGMDPAEVEEGLRRFALVPGGYIYFPVGTFEPRKNIPRVIEAFERMGERIGERTGTELRLVISGVGDTSWFEPSIRTDRVRIVQWNSVLEKDALFRGALYVLYPSLYEGFGIPVVEAFAHHKAVLTSRNTSLTEIGGDAAHLVDAGDSECLFAGMSRLALDADYRASLEERSRQRAGEFSWEKMARETMAVYARALERSTPRSSTRGDSARSDHAAALSP